jgi:glycosyltransferase involved in cell wall biosynthesis
MTLAVVIPYYRLTFFEKTLAALAAQTDNRFKVYIGDDASPDSPAGILDEYRNKLDFTYKRFDVNLGGRSLVSQWRRCLELCNEDWVIVLGDDDVLGENCVAEFYAHFDAIKQQKLSVLRFATQIIDQDDTPQSTVFTHPEIEKSTDFIYRKETGQTRSSLGEYIFERSKLSAVGFVDFPLAWHSDDMAILQCSDFGNIYSLNHAVVSIRVSGSSISGDESNIVEKKKATYLFYSALAFGYAHRFTKIQRRKIIGKVEQYFYKHKSIALFVKIAGWHARRGIGELLKFVRRTLRN